MKRNFFFLIIIAITNCLNAQNIFDKKFSDCDTEHFVMESDTISIFPRTDIKNTIVSHFKENTIENVQGILLMQIIVDLKGESCLVSLENKTNIPLEKLDLKKAIDDYVNWNPQKKKTSIILRLEFVKGEIILKRYGLHSERGFHELK